MSQQASLWELFGVFAKMGAFTIGGGYAMLPLIEQEMTSRGWISREDIQDIIVLAQSAPGILAVNMAIYTGHKIKGLPGSIVAAVGAVLPSLLIILLIAMFFTEFKDNDIVRRTVFPSRSSVTTQRNAAVEINICRLITVIRSASALITMF